MLAINTSIAKSINKTLFKVVFGRHPRTDDDIWKSIFNHQQQGDINKIILEEDLPDEIANIVKGTDYADSELISAQDDNNQLKINEKTISIEYQKVDDAPQNTIFDQEEDIEKTESADCVIDLNINPEFNDRHRRIREEAEQSYLKNAQSQLSKYNINSAMRQRTYVIDDIVGLNVSDVDRTNTSSTILPCKVINKYSKNDETLKRLPLKMVLSKSVLSKWHF